MNLGKLQSLCRGSFGEEPEKLMKFAKFEPERRHEVQEIKAWFSNIRQWLSLGCEAYGSFLKSCSTVWGNSESFGDACCTYRVLGLSQGFLFSRSEVAPGICMLTSVPGESYDWVILGHTQLLGCVFCWMGLCWLAP